MYEGAPNWPDFSRFWKIIDDHKVSIFYTAPTAIRAFIKWGDQYVEKFKLDSLRLLGTVGEPINPSKRGCGIGRRLGTTAARSWIHAGKRRRVRY